MRAIRHIVVHCTATPPETTIESIKSYWKDQLGWKNPGYHYIIKRSGEIVQLLGTSLIANGVAGQNKYAVHIAYIGGVDKNGNPYDNRTFEQKEAMFDLLLKLADKYPLAKILGHRDFPGVTKACPSFDVKSWLYNYVPDFDHAA